MERVVVENNHLSTPSNQSRSEELVNCHGDADCRSDVKKKYQKEYDAVQDRIKTCTGPDQCVAVAKELRTLQSDYIARASELQEKYRAHGSLTEAQAHEWVQLRGALSNIEASRDLVVHRAQMTGGSEETNREIVNIIGSAGIASAGGIAGGIGKGKPAANAVGKGSAIPVPEPVKAKNGLVYKSNSKHTLGGEGNRPNAGIEPKNSLILFEKSTPLIIKGKEHKARYTMDSNGDIHRFYPDNAGGYHWSGSTADKKNKLELPNDVRSALRKQNGWKIK